MTTWSAYYRAAISVAISRSSATPSAPPVREPAMDRFEINQRFLRIGATSCGEASTRFRLPRIQPRTLWCNPS